MRTLGAITSMAVHRDRAVIQRNLAELQRAILDRTTLLGLEDAGVSHMFLTLTYYALFNDYVAHCIKVFEKSRHAASFWDIHHRHKHSIEAIARSKGVNLKHLETVTEKLKKIRNKTHFHIDIAGVLDAKAVWWKAGLTGRQLSTAVDGAWEILNDLQRSLGGSGLSLPAYDRNFVRRVAVMVEEGRVP
jgi:hypothetical protein